MASKKKYLKNLSSQMGYSLIELLVIISIMGVISTVSIASFVTFTNTQSLDGAASDVANYYTLARQRSLSQIKPSQCTAAESLNGYKVVINTVASTYQFSGMCGASVYIIGQKKLPPNITFANTSPPNVIFNVPNANVDTQKTITINGFGKTKKIIIDSSGSISQQ
jgi:type II secretory pathway pseudopilin PulG